MIRSNVAIRTRYPELVEFFYPTYTKTKEFSPFIDGGVIFEGDSSYLQKFRDNNIPYIYIKGTPEFDLTIPENLLNFVFDKWDKKPTKALHDYFISFDKSNDELEEISKQIWITGKYTFEEATEDRMKNVYSLLTRGSTYEILKEYTLVSEDINSDKLFYSIQRFLKQSNDISSISNPKRKLQIQQFNEARGGNVESALLSFLYSPADNNELKLMKLFDRITEIKR